MKEFYVNKEICSRIKTSKDLSDFFACCDEFLETMSKHLGVETPSYLFEDNEHIENLMGSINYKVGEYDYKNVKRILGLI